MIELLLRREGWEGVAAIEAKRAEEALEDLRALRLVRHAHEPLLDRVWSLRHNLSAYDALYVALAEGLPAPLVTLDRRIADSPGRGADVRVP